MEAPNDRESVLARYMEGPALLEQVLAGLNEADMDTPPAGGGWTIRQIAHHIADGDDLWKTCIKAALGDAHTEFTLEWYRALPQAVWSDRWAYAHRSLDVSLALLKANRDHVRQLLDHLPDGWHRSVGFREPDGAIEQVPTGFVVKMLSDHVVHHVNRILAIRREIGGA